MVGLGWVNPGSRLLVSAPLGGAENHARCSASQGTRLLPCLFCSNCNVGEAGANNGRKTCHPCVCIVLPVHTYVSLFTSVIDPFGAFGPLWQAKSSKKTDGEQSEMVRDNLRRALRPLSPEAVLVLGFPGMLVKTRDTLVGDSTLLLLCVSVLRCRSPPCPWQSPKGGSVENFFRAWKFCPPRPT